MTITAWYMDASTEDQRLPHKTDREVSSDQLDSLGVLHWSGIAGEDCPRLAQVLTYTKPSSIYIIQLFSKFYISCLFIPHLPKFRSAKKGVTRTRM